MDAGTVELMGTHQQARKVESADSQSKRDCKECMAEGGRLLRCQRRMYCCLELESWSAGKNIKKSRKVVNPVPASDSMYGVMQ